MRFSSVNIDLFSQNNLFRKQIQEYYQSVKEFGFRSGPTFSRTWPQGYKTFFMLNSTDNEISTAHEN